MTSSKPAYSSLISHKSSLPRDPLLTEANRVIKEIRRGKDHLMSQMYPAHRTAVQSVLQTDGNMHLLFILYAIQTLKCGEKAITSETILEMCLNLLQTLPTHFSEDLFQLFPSIEDKVDARAEAPSGVPRVDAAGATNFVTTPVNEAATSLPLAPSTPSRRTPGQDFVDDFARGGGQANSNASSPIVQDELDNVSFSTRSAAPVEPVVNISAKPDDESLLGATASTLNVASFRIPEQKEGSQHKGGDPRADGVRHVKECLWAVQHENKILETYKQCFQCKKNPRDITFLPCGHFITCRQCAGPIFTCMLCNRAILATIDTYLS